MHIPENYLSPSTCAVMGAAMIPAWTISIKKIKTEFTKEKFVSLGTCAAFSFLGMMFNIPIPGGTTGHAVGAVLIACLLGPYASCLAVSIALLVQCLLFGDGGLLAFGANCFNMAFAMPFVGYFVYTRLRKYIYRSKCTRPDGGKYEKLRDVISAGIASYIGINIAALCAAIEFGIQPMLFRDVNGQALYCPYGLNISIPSMMIGHLTLFGLADVIFTVFILSYILQTSKTTSISVCSPTKKSGKYTLGLIAALIMLTPLGLLATGTAWGEWGSDEISCIITNGKVLGYTPSGLSDGFNLNILLPDYTISGLPEWTAYIFSAIIGVAIVIIFFKIISTFVRKKESVFDAD